jgi:hypothetical protein
MGIYYGIVIPIEEFFEAICLEKTGTKNLYKLCELIPYDYDDDNLNEYLGTTDYVGYLEYNLIDKIFRRNNGIEHIRFFSQGNKLTTYIFVGMNFTSQIIINCEDINKYVEDIATKYKETIESEIKILKLDKYEIHVSIGLELERDRKLHDNYVPRYRKL